MAVWGGGGQEEPAMLRKRRCWQGLKEAAAAKPPLLSGKCPLPDRCQGSVPKAGGASGTRWGSQQTDSRGTAAGGAGSAVHLSERTGQTYSRGTQAAAPRGLRSVSAGGHSEDLVQGLLVFLDAFYRRFEEAGLCYGARVLMTWESFCLSICISLPRLP